MKKNCYETLIRWDHAIRDDWKRPSISDDRGTGIWFYNHPEEIFRREWISEWRSKGMLFSAAMLFWRPAWFMNREAHVDIHSPANRDRFSIGAFNAIIGGEGSQMLWFDRPSVREEDYRITQAGTAYLSWPISRLKEVERSAINGPHLSLVRVDVPHAIYVGPEPRWCISIRTSDMMTFGSWDEMVDVYSRRGVIKD